MVHVDHRFVPAGNLPDRAHHGEIVLDTEAELHLVRAKSLRDMALGFLREARGLAPAADAIETGGVRLHARPEHAAEEPRYRLAARLASNVPAGDVERADRTDERAFLAVVARVVIHPVPEHFGLERIGADRERRERVLDGGRGDLRRLQSLAERLAPADEAFVRAHFDERGRAGLYPALREGKRLLEC